MSEYIEREVAVCIANDAENVHPYKVAKKPETYSSYNEGWADACCYIQCKLEGTEAAYVEPAVRCQDCKCSRAEHGYLWCLYLNVQVQFTDHCCWGERKKQDA